MDNAEVVSEVHGSESRVHVDSVLTEIDVTNEKTMEEIWDRLLKLDYCFDDLTKARADIWLTKCFMPTTKLWRIEGDVGLVQIEDIIPPVGATLHYAAWGELTPSLRSRVVSRVFSLAFDNWKLTRLTAVIPTSNPVAKRFALQAGFRFEGSLRKSWLKSGIFYDLDLFGILRSEWETRKKVN